MGPARVPNMSASIDEVFSNDEWVAAKLTWSGTHEGTFLGIEPTGRTFNVTEFEIVGIVDGWIVELRELADMPSLIAQLSAPRVTP
jgi:predicted ester cyclase